MKAEQLIREAVDAFTNKEIGKELSKYFSEQYIAHSGSRIYQGHEFLIKWTKQFHKALSEVKIIVIMILSENNNLITWQRTFSGVHSGSLKGIPASNKKNK